MALTAGSATNIVASSTNTGLVSLSLLSGNQLQLQYTTPAVAPTGNIGVDLFIGQNAVVGASLASGTFNSVALTASAVPEPKAASYMLSSLALLIFTTTLKVMRRNRIAGS